LASLSGYYVVEFINPYALQRYSSIFEAFLFEVMKLLLRNNPGAIRQSKQITIGEILKKNRNCEAIIDEAIDEELNRIRFMKPADWFDYVDDILNRVRSLWCARKLIKTLVE